MGRKLFVKTPPLPDVLPIHAGGLGGSTVQEAIQTIDSYVNDKAGQVNGLVPLDGNGQVKLQYLNVDSGAVRIIYNPLETFSTYQTVVGIVNYDFETEYVFTSPTLTITRYTDFGLNSLAPCEFIIEPPGIAGYHKLFINNTEFNIYFIDINGGSGGGGGGSGGGGGAPA